MKYRPHNFKANFNNQNSGFTRSQPKNGEWRGKVGFSGVFIFISSPQQRGQPSSEDTNLQRYQYSKERAKENQFVQPSTNHSLSKQS